MERTREYGPKYIFLLVIVYLISLFISLYLGRFVVVQMVVDTFLLVSSILIIFLLRYPRRFIGTVIFVYWFLTKITISQVLKGISVEMMALLTFVYGVMLLLVVEQYMSIGGGE